MYIYICNVCIYIYMYIFRFILSDRLDFHVIDNLSIAVHTFASPILISLSVDETLPPLIREFVY